MISIYHDKRKKTQTTQRFSFYQSRLSHAATVLSPHASMNNLAPLFCTPQVLEEGKKILKTLPPCPTEEHALRWRQMANVVWQRLMVRQADLPE